MYHLVSLCMLLFVAIASGYAPTQASLTTPNTTSMHYVSSTIATPPPTLLDQLVVGEDMLPNPQPCHELCHCQFSETGHVFRANCENVTNFEELTELYGPQLKILDIENCVVDNVTKIYTWNGLDRIEELYLRRCENASQIFENFKHFKKLRRLAIGDSTLTDFKIDCFALRKMEFLDLSENSLEELNIFDDCENSMPLKSLNLNGNYFSYFDWNQLVIFPNLEKLNLSHNHELMLMTPAEFQFQSFHSLDLNSDSKLRSICNNLLHSMPNVKYVDLAQSGLNSLPTQIFKLSKLEVLKIHSFTPKCNCEMAYLVQEHTASSLFNHFENLECQEPASRTKLSVMDPDIFSILDCSGAEITSFMNDTEMFVKTEVLLDCPSIGFPNPTVLWLTPRYELLRFKPDPEEDCVPVEDEIILSDSITDYSRWENHFTVLPNGSLLIDQFGWRDRGLYKCYVDNNFGNDSLSVELTLNYHYRNVVYYWSLVYGFSTALGFLAITLLGKLVHYLLWNYGCCYCCGCCHSDPPPKTKRLTAVVDSIEAYRMQQLENLRNNYTQQSQRIRDNYDMQLKSLRENYTSQSKGMRNYSSDGYNNVKEQYCDNINRIRGYSNGQLTRCHENYIFQRQRLRKFSAQNYLKIRETGKYTQKTLNRVIESMPTLYVDLTSCRQGPPEWDTEDLEGGVPQLEMADMGGIGESQSLYFTPAGTPLRDGPGGHVPFSDNPGGNPYSPVYSPSPVGKTEHRKSHKRMVSNLSNFLPFWWGMGQTDPSAPVDTGTTIAIVEQNHNHDSVGCGGTVANLNDVKLVIKNGEAVEVKDDCFTNGEAVEVKDAFIKSGNAVEVKDTVIKNGESMEVDDTTSIDLIDGATGQSV
eukprot:TRINITY_DN18168_c0_g1_i1.p1 TRINITY_DN18168_c0_g1~~TRINITY_DN18168_c0_g1_i1.p1  ORF type:complete len:868 (+),score=159.25 TRINITY_DN18168_c0_g1_i1:67-2670(+)